jgi:hypothetical protein
MTRSQPNTSRTSGSADAHDPRRLAALLIVGMACRRADSALAFRAYEFHNPTVPEEHPYSFQIAPDRRWPARFRWTVLETGHDRRMSLRAFKTYGDAKADVLREIDKLASIPPR